MFDTIVLGNDPGSLVAALTLANRGGKTLLVTNDALQCYQESGYTFDIDPFPWSGFNRGHVFRQFVSHLGIPQEELPLNPMLQIIFRKHRVALRGTVEWDIKEVTREFPDDASEIARFYKSLAKCGSFVSHLVETGLHLRPSTLKARAGQLCHMPSIALRKRTFASRLATMQRLSSIEKMLQAQLLLLSHLDPHAMSPLASARTLCDAMQGLTYYRDGKHALMQKLKKKFEADGGVIERQPISTVEIDRVIKINIKTDGTKDGVPTIYGKNMIVSTGDEKFGPLLEEIKGFSPLRRRFVKVQPSLYPFTLYMGVNDRCIPEQMGPYVAVISDEAESIEEGNLLFLAASEPNDTHRAPDGKRAVSVTSFLSTHPSSITPDVLKKTAEDMLRNLGMFLPFVGENIDFFDLEQSITLSKERCGIAGARYRAKSHRMGLSLFDNRTPLRNVFLTGGLIIPGLGFEGEIVSGLNAARLATGRKPS